MRSFLMIVFLLLAGALQAQTPKVSAAAYKLLPLGAIKPEGWLAEMLNRQRSGATARLDELYPTVMGKRNGWLGGDGDQWERGPYWIDGLLPLAYILNDEVLKTKVQAWVEWAIASQQPDGYFGPRTDYSYEPGLQRDNSHDWWPKMVMLKVLQQYYSATNDQRVINLFTNYFKYQLKQLPEKPLDHWTFWARYRAGDNLQVVYWLYEQTKEPFLLELGEILHKQSFDFTEAFLNTDLLSRKGSIHCVNLAQGFKEPIIYWQHNREQRYLDAVTKGFADLDKYNGMAHGLYGGDEGLHGNNPTQGSELCSAVEMMFSLESMLSITGNTGFAERLEKIAFNILPAQISEDFMSRQYFLQANQVMLTRAHRNFDVNHNGTDICYGLLTGFPCCTSNMHQGWPKFTQNLWYATPDSGLAALVYSPSSVSTTVAGGQSIQLTEETGYPFEDRIRFRLRANKPVQFPLHLRIPAWCREASILINGKPFRKAKGGQIEVIQRQWSDEDLVELQLPMHLYHQRWYENSVSVERGPLVYGLKIPGTSKQVQNTLDPVQYGASFVEVRPNTPWNFGLPETSLQRMDTSFSVQVRSQLPAYPWTLQAAPVILTTTGKRIPNWTLYNEMAGPLPYSVIYNEGMNSAKREIIQLIPMGCTQLRITQFPVVGRE